MPKKRSEEKETKSELKSSTAGSKPFGGKVDEIVAKAIPERWLATAFAGAAAGAVLLFILMIIGFARSPEAATQAKLEDGEKTLADERAKVADAEKELGEALKAKRDSDGKAKSAEGNAKRLQRQLDASTQAQEKLVQQINDLRGEVNSGRAKLRETEGQRKTAAAAAERVKAKAGRERETAQKKEKALRDQIGTLKAELGDARKDYGKLEKTKEEREKVLERARAAFEMIMETAPKIEDPQERIETVQRLRDTSEAELAGTVYMERLTAEIKHQQSLVAKRKRAAEKMALKDAKGAYAEAMRKLKMATDYESQMEILREAKDQTSGTDYEVKVHKEMEKREGIQRNKVARKAYEELLGRLKKTPRAYEENLKALKEGLATTKDTRYEAALKRLIDPRERTLKGDVARVAYQDLIAKIKRAPREYGQNIAAAEEALEKATGTRYEAKVRKQLDRQKRSQAASEK